MFVVGLTLVGTAVRAESAQAAPIRISITPSDAEGRGKVLRQWADYLGQRLGRPVIFIQRNSRTGVELLHQQNVDFAWIASHHYVRFQHWIKLLAVPTAKEGWRSYLIATAADSRTRGLADLRGTVFVYPEPAAYLELEYLLSQQGEMAESFFGKSFTTNSPRGVVEAVAVGLAQGGIVDGQAWEALRNSEPELAGRTRVVQSFRDLGPAPLAARTSIGAGEFKAMQEALIGMERDPEGQRLLKELNLDGFAPANPAMFDGVVRMVKIVHGPNTHAESSRP